MPLKHNLMTTLHGLVTISELFADFNLINTGVVNCLIMCQNACKMHHSESKNPKLFWVPPKTPPGEGNTPLKPHPLSACGASIDLPPNESPGSASG